MLKPAGIFTNTTDVFLQLRRFDESPRCIIVKPSFPIYEHATAVAVDCASCGQYIIWFVGVFGVLRGKAGHVCWTSVSLQAFPPQAECDRHTERRTAELPLSASPSSFTSTLMNIRNTRSSTISSVGGWSVRVCKWVRGELTHWHTHTHAQMEARQGHKNTHAAFYTYHCSHINTQG